MANPPQATLTFKARQTPNLAFKLHKLGNVETTGHGVAAARRPNRALGQGKRQIWLGVAAAGEKLASSAAVPPSRARARPDIEALRSALVMRLRKYFRNSCLSAKVVPPLLAFERWLFDGMLQRTEDLPGDVAPSGKGNMVDPLLPVGVTNVASSSLVNDLVRASMPRSTAESVTRQLLAQSAEAVKTVAAAAAAAPNPAERVVVIEHRHTVDVQLITRKCSSQGRAIPRRVLKLNHEHWRKLCALWRLARGDSAEDAAAPLPAGSADHAHLSADLFCLLSRYFSLQGHGFQAACSEHVFRVLESALGVTHECFASPLNCFFPSFCSAFPDVDAPFGSLGSFWDLSVDPARGGSFQANPPFVAAVMLRMVDRIEALLAARAHAETTQAGTAQAGSAQAAGAQAVDAQVANRQAPTPPISFVVVVPCWLEDESFQRLCRSRFLQAKFVIPKADHGFCDGAQHQRRDRYRSSPYDTAVFVLQNARGAKQWPVHSGGAASEDETAALGERLRSAFAQAVPTAAAVARRRRDGRGFADEDGGGGVYKGKKGKRKKPRAEGAASQAKKKRKRRKRAGATRR
jgi:phosphorylated CTD-interacting factor 1